MAAAKAKTADPAEVETELDDDAAAARKPKSKLLNRIMIGGAILVVAVGGAAGTYFFVAHNKAAPEKSATAVVKPAVFVDLPDILVNLSTPSGDRTQYLRVKVVLELADQALIQQIQPVMPRVMDAFQTYLRELRPTDLDGSAGLYRLKEELTRRVNAAIAPNRINAVLFKEIVVQ